MINNSQESNKEQKTNLGKQEITTKNKAMQTNFYAIKTSNTPW